MPHPYRVPSPFRITLVKTGVATRLRDFSYFMIGAPLLLRFPSAATFRPVMPTLLEKIETNAAGRLILPEGRKPAEELARYKNFLKVETHRLKILHRAGGGGREVCQARSAILD